MNKHHTEGSGKATPPVCRYIDQLEHAGTKEIFPHRASIDIRLQQCSFPSLVLSPRSRKIPVSFFFLLTSAFSVSGNIVRHSIDGQKKEKEVEIYTVISDVSYTRVLFKGR